jgi:hypothetical protein
MSGRNGSFDLIRILSRHERGTSQMKKGPAPSSDRAGPGMIQKLIACLEAPGPRNPDVAVAARLPATFHPDGVGLGARVPCTVHPNVRMSVPAPVAADPHVIRRGPRGFDNYFSPRRRRRCLNHDDFCRRRPIIWGRFMHVDNPVGRRILADGHATTQRTQQSNRYCEKRKPRHDDSPFQSVAGGSRLDRQILPHGVFFQI